MNVTHGQAQNWCQDPYGRHEARWFSRGIPTALVRDRSVESQDPPPDSAFAHRYGMLDLAGPTTPTEQGPARRSHRMTDRWTDSRRAPARRP